MPSLRPRIVARGTQWVLTGYSLGTPGYSLDTYWVLNSLAAGSCHSTQRVVSTAALGPGQRWSVRPMRLLALCLRRGCDLAFFVSTPFDRFHLFDARVDRCEVRIRSLLWHQGSLQYPAVLLRHPTIPLGHPEVPCSTLTAPYGTRQYRTCSCCELQYHSAVQYLSGTRTPIRTNACPCTLSVCLRSFTPAGCV